MAVCLQSFIFSCFPYQLKKPAIVNLYGQFVSCFVFYPNNIWWLKRGFIFGNKLHWVKKARSVSWSYAAVKHFFSIFPGILYFRGGKKKNDDCHLLNLKTSLLKKSPLLFCYWLMQIYLNSPSFRKGRGSKWNIIEVVVVFPAFQ